MRCICTSDWHLSGTRPLMRTDSDWIATQAAHIEKIREYAMKYNAVVFVAGDLHDVPTVPPVVLTLGLDLLVNCDMAAIAGNHDLPYHSADKMWQSSFGVIRKVSPMLPAHIDAADFGLSSGRTDGKIIVRHAFSVKEKKDIPPTRDARTAEDWHKEFPNAELIILGDNHTPWYTEIDGQFIVNCGCLIQRTATDAQHPCGFYYVDTDAHTCKYVDLSYLSVDCIDLSYLDMAKEKEVQAASYEGLVEELKGSVGKSFDFPNTLREYTEQNRSVLGEKVADFLEGVVDYIKEN